MSTEYTISEVSEKTREYGDKRVYYVRLNGAEADVPSKAFELHKLQKSKPPESGHRLDVKTFQKGEFQGAPFVKIIQDFKDRAAGGSSGGGRDDATGQSIERQTAAKAAAEMAAATSANAGPVAVIANFEAMFDAVIAKIHGAPQSPPRPAQEVPADTAGLGQQQVSPDASVPF